MINQKNYNYDYLAFQSNKIIKYEFTGARYH